MAGPTANVTGATGHKWLALICSASGTLMATLNTGNSSVALPAIGSDFGVPLTTSEWVVVAYFITIAGLMVSTGRLADLFGRRALNVAGYAIFAVAACGCALAPSIWWLIAARVVQAVGAAMIVANGPAIITDNFPSHERGWALGIIGTVVGIGLSGGPALGGIIIDLAGWRAIFLVNLPVVAVGLVLSVIVLRKRAGTGPVELDPVGAGLLFATLGAVMVALSQGHERGWTSPLILGVFAVFALTATGLVLWETWHPAPTLDFRLFRNRAFASATLSALVGYAGMSAPLFLLPFYLVRAQGYSNSQAGLMIVPMTLTLSAVAFWAGSLSDRLGTRLLAAGGLGSVAAGLLLLGWLDPATGNTIVFVALVLIGVGYGFFEPPNNSSIMGSAPPDQQGVAAGILAVVRSIGLSLGVAISAAAFATREAHYLAIDGEGAAAAGRAFVLATGDAFLVIAAITLTSVGIAALRGKN